MSFCDEGVECVKNIDLTKGFSSWHIKWTIGKIKDADDGYRRYSSSFQIPRTDKNKLGQLLLCHLSMWIPEDEADNIDIKLKMANVHFPTLVVYRFAIVYDGSEMVLTKSHAGVQLNRAEDVELSVRIDGSLFKRKCNPVVHCWLDIPSVIINDILNDDYSYCYICMPSHITGFLKKTEVLYESTMDPNGAFASHSDVTLILSGKSDGRFYCHRNILAVGSPVFATMFSTAQWKEGGDGTVEIEDIDEKTMQAVLYHIYTGQFKETESNNLSNLIYAADKYQLNELKAWVEIQLMAAAFTDSERIDCLLLAERHQLHNLRAVCIAMLSTNLRVMSSDEIKEKVGQELREELIKAVEKRQVKTSHISVGSCP